ncbi:MAG: hypothetical protein V1872_07000 [bacterium]
MNKVNNLKRVKKKKGIVAMVVMLFFFVFVFNRYSEAMEVGRFKLKIDTLVEETYADNVFLDKYNKKDAFITMIVPMISINRGGEKYYLELEYDARLSFYDKYSSENQYYQHGAWNLGMNRTSKSKVGIKGEDMLTYVERDPRGKSVRSNLIEVNDLTLTPYVTQKIGEKYDIGLSYTWHQRDYKENYYDEELMDSNSHTINADFIYKFTNNFSLLTGYRYTLTYFQDATPDYTENEIYGGFGWDNKDKFKIETRLGYAWNENEFDVVHDYITSDSSIDILFLPDTIINIIYIRSWKFTSVYDTQTASYISDNLSTSVRHYLFDEIVEFRYGVGYVLSNYKDIDREDKLYNANAGISWNILKPIVLLVDGRYSKADYRYDLDTLPREDKEVGGGCGLEWKIFNPVLLSLNAIYTKIDYTPGNREDELYEGLGALSYSLTDNFFIETRYQYLENKSFDEENQKPLEENEYVANRYSLGLRMIF